MAYCLGDLAVLVVMGWGLRRCFWYARRCDLWGDTSWAWEGAMGGIDLGLGCDMGWDLKVTVDYCI